MDRKLKFDLTVDANALLCPNPQEFYSKAYINEDIVANYRTLPGIKSATKIANVVFDDILKASTCNFTEADQTLDALDIDVSPLSAMSEICRFDIESAFVSLQMAKGSNGSFEVPAFMAYYWDEMAKEIADEIAVLRWQGDTAGATGTYLDLVDGHEKLLLADASVVKQDAVAITSANVLAQMQVVYELLPARLQQNKADLRFHVSSNVATAYELAAASGNTLAYVTEALTMSYLGVKIVVNPGMSDNTMVLTTKDNLIYAFDGEGDGKALKAVNLEESIAEPLLRTRANMKVGFHHANPTEIVLYHEDVTP
jgi:hypothetical protein